MESTLALKRSDYQEKVALFLGWDPTGEAWSPSQRAMLKEFVDSGLRQFYFPPATDTTPASYDWSFLRPIATIVLDQDGSTCPLPDDFGGIEGQVSMSSGTSSNWYPLSLTGEGTVRQAYAGEPTRAGPPQSVAVVPLKGSTAIAGQRFQLYVWPAADQEYTLHFRYYVLSDCLTDAFPYALGGMAHSETILESCLAIAEQRLDDSVSIHSMKFMERLQASVSHDRRFKPQSLGYNGDASDLRGSSWRELYMSGGVTFAGVSYP